MDFFLGDKIDAAQKTVATFFETNENYSNDKPLSTISHDPAEFEVDNYINMIRSTANSPLDDRKSSIEIQFQEVIDLTKTKILEVVIPESLMQSNMYMTLLAAHGVKPTPYVMTRGSTSEYDGVLISEYTKLLRAHL